MSGDITDMLPLPDSAGIVPRVLYHLFGKLEKDDMLESNVKCSFIELYNEELRDLLALDETVKLKIYDDANKKGHAATLVQGMEEFHIKSASKGIELLRDGSHKRQVAATKCNDLSSRSHTVFTITVYMKRTSDTGEELISAGKLNLVDLAGSENIQRSGAENKRAAEAGLINKSLLTLGRVINALVEKSSHIPYRESKLTRLLQDSLGGRTKTCIIATLSPAKSNLEETISTLDYAFRAKNIRNKPQMNQLMSKKTLIREYTSEIEKLKSELIATRQRNGVYLTSENYEELTTESESRRILAEEQRDRIETMEANLRNKAQELFSLTISFNGLRKDNEVVQATLDGTQDVLKKTEAVLLHTEQSLRDENMLRKAHQATEEDLARVGGDLISTLGQTTADIGGLHSKIRRRSDLQSLNRDRWTSSQNGVSDVTSLVQEKLKAFEEQHNGLMTELSSKMSGFLEQELTGLTQSKSFLTDKVAIFEKAEAEVNVQTGKARDDMNHILEEIKALKEDVKTKVGEGLDGLAVAAKQISAGVMSELEKFHTQLHTSYSSLGKDFKHTFDDLVKQLNHQQAETDELRNELKIASAELASANETASTHLNTVLAEEKERAAADRDSLIAQMTTLIHSNGELQDKRLESKINGIQVEIKASTQRYDEKHSSFQSSMDCCLKKDKSIVDEILKSRESVKTKIKKDWTVCTCRCLVLTHNTDLSKAANEQNHAIQSTTQSVHEETIRIVDDQMKHLDIQLQALDEILSKVRNQNTHHHDAHIESLTGLATSVKQSYASIGEHLTDSSLRAQAFESDFTMQTSLITDSLAPLEQDIHVPLSELRENVLAAPLVEYSPTGQTPQKSQYQYQSILPRTQPHAELLRAHRGEPSHIHTSTTTPSTRPQSPTKTTIYTDTDVDNSPTRPSSRPQSAHSSLRELDINIAPASMKTDAALNSAVDVKALQPNGAQPPFKRQNTGFGKSIRITRVSEDGTNTNAASFPPSDGEIREFSTSSNSKLPKKPPTAEGRENVPFGASVGAIGRQLRSRGS